jgi:hypothetical protein
MHLPPPMMRLVGYACGTANPQRGSCPAVECGSTLVKHTFIKLNRVLRVICSYLTVSSCLRGRTASGSLVTP